MPLFNKRPTLAIYVHGGAGSIARANHHASQSGCERAAQVGWRTLLAGSSALDAVEAAVNIMEEDPTFDAGRGAFLNARGEIELDAMIMVGITLNFGAVAAVQNILNPVSLMDYDIASPGQGLGVLSWATVAAVKYGFSLKLEPERKAGL